MTDTGKTIVVTFVFWLVLENNYFRICIITGTGKTIVVIFA